MPTKLHVRLSIRGRVAIASTVLVAIALAVTGVVVVTVQRTILTDRVDSAVSQRAEDIASLIAGGNAPEALVSARRSESFIQIVDPAGMVIASTANIATVGAFSVSEAGRGVYDLQIVALDADETFRVAVRLADSQNGRLLVLVGDNLEAVNDSGETLILILSIAFFALTVVSGTASWFLVGRALAPVESIRREVASIDASNLGRRVQEPHSRDEIAALSRTMNAMLERIEEGHARQRQFISDASHELRSPLAALRTTLEVTQAHGDQAERSEMIGLALRDVDRMESLTSDLLMDAELQAERGREFESVDLDDLVFEEVNRLRLRGGASLDTAGVSAAQVAGDRGQLQRAIRNILENAHRYAEGEVKVSLAEINGLATLTVSDDGPGIPAEKAEMIFERFTRLADARDRDGGGAGLGLAITRAIALRHGGRAYADTSATAGARLVLELPASS